MDDRAIFYWRSSKEGQILITQISQLNAPEVHLSSRSIGFEGYCNNTTAAMMAEELQRGKITNEFTAAAQHPHLRHVMYTLTAIP